MGSSFTDTKMKKNKKIITKNLKRELPVVTPLAALNLDRRVSNTLLDDTIKRNLDFTRLQIIPADVKKSKSNIFQDKFFFKNPVISPVCQKRKIRRRALFAAGIAGKIKVKKAKWNERSKVSC